MSTSNHDWGSIAIGTIFWGVIAAIIFWAPIENAITANKVTCADKVIPYSTNTTYLDDSMYEGESKVTQKGLDGSERVCTHKDGSVESNTVLVKPIDQVTAYGSKAKYVAPEPTNVGCAVTTCNDGSCSYSIGRGTCSWHGGVAYYN